MKRLLSTVFSLVLISTVALAQMTDSQVMQFVAREHKAGTANSQIVTKLMQRGVKIEQIRRVRNQYEKQQKQQSSGYTDAVAASSDSDSRLRTNNGQPYNNNQPFSPSSNIPYNGVATAVDSLGDQPFPLFQDEALIVGGRKVFGRDIFNNRALTFEPSMNLATPQNYVVGPGDRVIVDIYGASQRTVNETVSPDGTVTIPGYGPIQLSGLTVSAANAKLRSTLGSRYSSSQIKLTVGQTRTLTVNVMGEVKAPGTYTLSAFASVFHALYMAGGISELGTLRNIKVFRGGRQVTTVDIYDYILNGLQTGNIRLQEGDVIIVGPYDCLVDVSGSVKRPMTYEMRKNESVSTLLKYAGGFSGNAYRQSVRLLRNTGSRKSVYNVEEFDMSSFQLDDGDVVTVDSILDRYENMVEVKGAVFRPGLYQLGSGITSVRSLIEHADGLKEDAFTARGVMHRRKADRSLEVLSVDVRGIMAGTSPDIPLRNEDVLFIPTQTDLQQERTLTVHGEVMYPGDYQYADNETLEDLILQAGGLTDAASTAKVDVARRIIDPSSTETSRELARTFTFSLKDGFVIDGEAGFTLQPYDEIYVRRSPGYQKQRNIRVEGEVLFGGTQTLAQKNQRLSDAIRNAGGVTDDAYVKGARLERTMNVDEAARRDFLMKQLKAQNNERDTIDMAKLETSNTYMVGIYLDKALANPGSEYDVVLREGDRIVVPEFNNTVKISGDVMYPNTVAYQKGRNYKWYVSQSGGFGTRAKKGKTWIIYQNGTMALAGKGAKIEPGCEIIVPTKPKKDGNSIAQWLTIGTSVTSMAAMIATIANMVK